MMITDGQRSNIPHHRFRPVNAVVINHWGGVTAHRESIPFQLHIVTGTNLAVFPLTLDQQFSFKGQLSQPHPRGLK